MFKSILAVSTVVIILGGCSPKQIATPVDFAHQASDLKADSARGCLR